MRTYEIEKLDGKFYDADLWKVEVQKKKGIMSWVVLEVEDGYIIGTHDQGGMKGFTREEIRDVGKFAEEVLSIYLDDERRELEEMEE